jgi:hypothetical protein
MFQRKGVFRRNILQLLYSLMPFEPHIPLHVAADIVMCNFKLWISFHSFIDWLGWRGDEIPKTVAYVANNFYFLKYKLSPMFVRYSKKKIENTD